MKKGLNLGFRFAGLFFIFLFLCFSFSSLVSASCSIGATPLGMGAKAKPGQTVEVVWNFYNLYGDRTTHITVSKSSGPNWEITYDPALHTANYDISGVITNKTENLAIENMSVVLTIPETLPEGISYVKHPRSEGYIPVKQIKMYITIPDNAKLWQDYGFTFEAKGDCFTEPGAVIPAVATQLRVNITATNDFYEKPVSDKKTGGITGSAIFGGGTITTILSITGIVFIIVLVFLLIKGIRKSAKRKTQAGNQMRTGSGMQGNETPPKENKSSDFSY